jgi:capsular polysaccharide biosynthesis protein
VTTPRLDWAPAVPPVAPPPGPARLTTVRGAVLTPISRGPLRTDGRPDTWIRGAVHNGDGALVVDSQRFAVAGSPWVAADPLTLDLPVPGPRRRLTGRWLYGGHWVQHFGHFLVETLTTLWPQGEQRGAVEGLVFHKYLHRPWTVEPWMQRLLDLAGHAGLPVHVVGQQKPLAVEELLVPSRPVVVRGWAQPEAVAVWDRVAAGREPGRRRTPGGRVFLTRTAVNAAARAAGQAVRTTPERDAELDEVFAAAGYDVVAPETLPLDDQLELVATAGELAGLTGSALHLAAFAPGTTRVLEIGDERTRDAGHPTQLALDAARGRERAFVPHAVPGPALAELLRPDH